MKYIFNFFILFTFLSPGLKAQVLKGTNFEANFTPQGFINALNFEGQPIKYQNEHIPGPSWYVVKDGDVMHFRFNV